MSTRNARFWVMINGAPAKITLRPGDSLHWGERRQHDEGWAADYYTWQHNGDSVLEDHSTDGVDCDGRHSSGAEWEAAIDRLAIVEPGGLDYLGKAERPAWDGVTWPEWQRADSWHRDYSAELANY